MQQVVDAQVYFITDDIFSISQMDVSGTREIDYYDLSTGLKRPQYIFPQAALEPFAEANGLRFYSDSGLRIEWNEQPVSLRLNPANYISANLSSDDTRLYINYTDGRVGIWAVGE
jgi:hypothetical protein